MPSIAFKTIAEEWNVDLLSIILEYTEYIFQYLFEIQK